MVDDPITSLRWQGCFSGLRGAQCEQGSAQRFKNLAEARSYCDTLMWGGHDDWTLPDIYALVSLFDLGTPRASLTENDAGLPIAGDAVATGEALTRSAFPRTQDVLLISSTSETSRVTDVSTSSGIVDVSPFATDLSAICMRLTQPPIPTADSRELNTKASNGEQVMFDPLTRTLWAPATPQDMKQPDALRFCDELRWAGIDDWRLPDIKELFGVFNWDHSRFLPGRDRMRAWNDSALSSASGTSATYGPSAAYPTRCVHYVE